MQRVSCAGCVSFVRDKVGFGDGIGMCERFERFLAGNPSSIQIDIARVKMGDSSLYPDRLRFCENFKEK